MKKIKSLAIIILTITIMILLSTISNATEGTANSETVRVRKEPNTTSTIIDQLDKGEKVEILEEAEGWYKVQLTRKGKKIQGYVSGKLLDVEKTEQETNTETPTEPEENNKVEENSSTENNAIEQEPEQQETTSELKIEESKQYEIQSKIETRILPLINSRTKVKIENGKITVTEIMNDWCKIENDTEEGWIRINTLKKVLKNEEQQPVETEQPPEQPVEEEQKPEETVPTSSNTVIKTAYVSTNSLKVRKEATTSSEEIDSLKKNDQVEILEELDGWYKIKISGGVGYVSSKYISDTKSAETTSRGGSTEKVETTPIEEEKVEKTTENKTDNDVKKETSSATGNAVVEYAKQYLGYKYISGGASPEKGFDCSGFTSYVYKKFGITLNRSSKDQIKNGVAVEKANLQPGDIVVFNGESNKSIGHVGIYIGEGNFIHASNPKGGVKITALSTSYYTLRYVGARRVI